MITHDNFVELIRTIKPKDLQAEIDKKHDYILMEAHIFNTGGFATVKSCDYDEDAFIEAEDHGNLFCDKDDFLRQLEETQALEY